MFVLPFSVKVIKAYYIRGIDVEALYRLVRYRSNFMKILTFFSFLHDLVAKLK